MDKILEAKLAELREKAEKIEALEQSMAEKKQLIANIQRTADKLKGMPAVLTMADQQITALKEEIEAEEKQRDEIKNSL